MLLNQVKVRVNSPVEFKAVERILLSNDSRWRDRSTTPSLEMPETYPAFIYRTVTGTLAYDTNEKYFKTKPWKTLVLSPTYEFLTSIGGCAFVGVNGITGAIHKPKKSVRKPAYFPDVEIPTIQSLKPVAKAQPKQPLRNIKARLIEGKSELIQRQLFDLGYQWRHSGKVCVEAPGDFLFADSDGYITCTESQTMFERRVTHQEVKFVEKIVYKLEDVPPELIEIGGQKFLKGAVLNAIDGLKPIQ